MERQILELADDATVSSTARPLTDGQETGAPALPPARRQISSHGRARPTPAAKARTSDSNKQAVR